MPRQPGKIIGSFTNVGGGTINLNLGGVPDKFVIKNMNAAVTEIAILEWYYGMGDLKEIQYDKFLAGTSAGDFFLKTTGAGLISAWNPGSVVGNRCSVTFDDTGGASEDLITCTETLGHGLKNNDKVFFVKGTTLPTNVSALAHYYVIDATPTTFRISTTRGGSAFNFGSDGTAPNYVVSWSDATMSADDAGAGVTIDSAFMDAGDILYFEAEFADKQMALGNIG